MLLLYFAYAFNVYFECMDNVFVQRLCAVGIRQDNAVFCVRTKYPEVR